MHEIRYQNGIYSTSFLIIFNMSFALSFSFLIAFSLFHSLSYSLSLSLAVSLSRSLFLCFILSHSLSLYAVRQVYSSPFLSGLSWLEGSGAHSLSSPYSSPPSSWHGGTFSRTPVLPHSSSTSSPFHPSLPLSSIRAPRSELHPPGLDCKDSLKGERVSPAAGAEGVGGVYTINHVAGGGVYPHDHGPPQAHTHTHTHSLGHYSSYSSPAQDYSSVGLYSPSYEKLRGKMTLSPTGEDCFNHAHTDTRTHLCWK